MLQRRNTKVLGSTPDAGDHDPPRSELEDASDRFLSKVIEHGFRVGLRTAEQFLRHFSPETIMRALADEPQLRASILEETVGLRRKIALRKSAASSGEDLQIALDEGVTTPQTIVRLFDPDARVRVLDRQHLWAYIVEPKFWHSASRDPVELSRVRQHTSYILRCALDERLLSGRDVVSAISVQTLVQCLPREEVAGLLERALLGGRLGDVFTDDALLEVLGLDTLASHVPLATIWEWVIGAKIAVRHGLGPDNEPLFDEQEAHPDATQEVTVIIDPSGSETIPGAASGTK
jgi:hypothetical protein